MRKIDSINQLRSFGLRTAEVKEFKHDELSEMTDYACLLMSKHGTFNVRTDTGDGVKNFNLPFIRNCTIEQLRKLVSDYGSKITYLIHQDIPVGNQLFNGVLRLCDGYVIGEVNDVDRTSLRSGMKVSKNLKLVCTKGNDPLFTKIKQDLLKVSADFWVELSAYNDNSLIYWQLVPEKMTGLLKGLFIKH